MTYSMMRNVLIPGINVLWAGDVRRPLCLRQWQPFATCPAESMLTSFQLLLLSPLLDICYFKIEFGGNWNIFLYFCRMGRKCLLLLSLTGIQSTSSDLFIMDPLISNILNEWNTDMFQVWTMYVLPHNIIIVKEECPATINKQ